MEKLPDDANHSDKPPTILQESEDKNDGKVKHTPAKSKIIRKKNKSKAKPNEALQHNFTAEIAAPNTMAPFGIFESEAQKCQRL